MFRLEIVGSERATNQEKVMRPHQLLGGCCPSPLTRQFSKGLFQLDGWRMTSYFNLQFTFELHRFELCGSANMGIFFNTYLYCFWSPGGSPQVAEGWLYTFDLCHFIWGTWTSTEFGICRGGGSWNQSPADTKEQLSFGSQKLYTDFWLRRGSAPQPPCSRVNCIFLWLLVTANIHDIFNSYLYFFLSRYLHIFLLEGQWEI